MSRGYRIEADLSHHFRDLLKAEKETMFRRIEDLSGKGTWDCFYAVRGRGAWVEFKRAGPNAKPVLRPGQLAFGLSLHEARHAGYYLIGHPDGSLRVLSSTYDGTDWRSALLHRWDSLTIEGILGMLM